MEKKLSIGIVGSIKGLNAILKQEGVPFNSIIEPSLKKLLKYPIIIIDSIVSKNNNIIKKYLLQGGYVLMSCKSWGNHFNKKIKHIKINYIESNNSNLFSNIGLIDIYNTIQVPYQHSLTPLDSSLFIYEQRIGLGHLIVYPFDLSLIMNDFSSLRKRFYDNRKECPSEIVSKVSKGKIRKIIFSCIKYFFDLQNLPLLSLWYYPQNVSSFFI